MGASEGKISPSESHQELPLELRSPNPAAEVPVPLDRPASEIPVHGGLGIIAGDGEEEGKGGESLEKARILDAGGSGKGLESEENGGSLRSKEIETDESGGNLTQKEDEVGHGQDLDVEEDEKIPEIEGMLENLDVKEEEKDSGSQENGRVLAVAEGGEKILENDEFFQNAAINEGEKDRESADSGAVLTEKENDKHRESEESENNVVKIQTENECENESIGNDSEIVKDGGKDSEARKGKKHQYPLRADAEDCTFYLRTGMCKYGMTCKFNHPIERKSKVVKEKVNESKENPDRQGQADCKYFLKTGGCKYGKACRYNHTTGKSPAVVESNFLGLPIRLGEKECPYYMRTGSCKYGFNCRFNHPDPTAGAGYEPATSASISLGRTSESTLASWRTSRTSNEASTFVPMMFPSTTSSNYDWNGYQGSVYSPERTLNPLPAFTVNSSSINKSVHKQHEEVLVEEYPERPGQPDCSYFIKTGECKFKSACRFHHPKSIITKSPSCTLSSEGLPLRPDQDTCMYYDRYGICKFGPACKFNHPTEQSSPTSSGVSGP